MLPHAGLELLFTPKEEVGLRGAAAFDCSRFVAKVGYVYDQAGPIGEVVLGAPYSSIMADDVHRPVRARRHGARGGTLRDRRRGARDRRHAARPARRGDHRERRRRSTAASPRNIVPDRCSFHAEARSHDERKLADVVQEMLDACTFAATLTGCEVEAKVEPGFKGYRFRKDDEPVRLARAALERTGREPFYSLSGGGADANIFNMRGLACVNLANGMAEIHSPQEHIAVDDLEGMVDVTLALLEEARAP